MVATVGTSISDLAITPLQMTSSNGAPVSPELQGPITQINAEASGSQLQMGFAGGVDPNTSGAMLSADNQFNPVDPNLSETLGL